MDILSDKIVITRKRHNCDACGRVFEKGTKMRAQVNTYGGIQTWRECPTCMELLADYRSHFEDSYNGICEENCVSEVLEKNETPEDLLHKLKNEIILNPK